MHSPQIHPVSRRAAAFCFSILASILGPAETMAQSSPRRSPPTDQASFFGLHRSWDIHLTVTTEALAAMYPKGSARMGLSQRGRFKYVQGSIEIGGKKFAKIGLRFKGNSTFWSTSGSLKRSYKIDFNKFEADQSFLGLTKINLQNNATDSSQVREAVAYKVYRDFEIPASRTAFARVFLTVEGKFDRNYVGNYTIVEQVDRRFLKQNFATKAGLIVKPEGRVMPFLGDMWHEDYEAGYIPKTPAKPEQTSKLIAMARLTSSGDDAAFAESIEQALDVEEFLRYSAVTLYLANLDSPFMLAHNFYMAVPAKENRVVWIPWDLNLSLGGFSMAGGNQTELSVFRRSSLPLFDKVLAIPRYKTLYTKLLRQLAAGPGSRESLTQSLQTARQATKSSIAQEAERSDAITKVEGDRSGFNFGGGFGRMFRAPGPDEFAAGRAAAVLAQLQDGAEGKPATATRQRSGFGGFGGFGRRSSPAATPEASLRRTIRRAEVLAPNGNISRAALLVAAKKLFAKIDTNDSQTLKRDELTKILRAQRGEDFKPTEARKLLREVDTDRNRRVSLAEWCAAYEQSFDAWDTDKDGTLSVTEIHK